MNNWQEKQDTYYQNTYWILPGVGKVFRTTHPTKLYEAYNWNSTKSKRCNSLDEANEFDFYRLNLDTVNATKLSLNFRKRLVNVSERQ